jgi:hypothetical protein
MVKLQRRVLSGQLFMSSLTISARSAWRLFLISAKTFRFHIIIVGGEAINVESFQNKYFKNSQKNVSLINWIEVFSLTCVNFPFCMLKLSIDSFRFVKLLSFRAWIFEFENWRCLIWIPFDDDENKSFDSMVTVRSKSYIDSDWMGAWIFCKLLRSSALVMPGHSRNNPVNGWEN